MTQMHPIQKLIFPDPELSDCPELYFRARDGAVRVRERVDERAHEGRPGHGDRPEGRGTKFLEVDSKAILTTDTFFNCLSLSPWSHATKLTRVALQVTIRGSCTVSVLHATQPGSTKDRVLQSEEVGTGTWRSDLFNIQDLRTGLLHVRIVAHSALELEAIDFVTDQAPLRPIQLGIVITTFNRQAQTLRALNRLISSLDDLTPRERDQYRIVVIDNGRNLQWTPTGRSTNLCEVLPNANLGGTGGFMRGLIELQSRGSFTHCLFMDDDASCFFESIARTKRIFEYSSFPKLAISGAMLLEDRSYLQYEYSAYFRRFCRPRVSGSDVRERAALIRNDEVSGHLILNRLLPPETHTAHGYGGWWFFAFAIQDVELYSFPFFVRGDDVFFAIHNRLRVFALNGVASWQECFDYKTAPITTYLDCRSMLLQTLLLPELGTLTKLAHCLWLIYYFVFRNLLLYRYPQAQATLCGVEDFLRGPQFWFESLPYDSHLKEVGNHFKMTPVQITGAAVREVGIVPRQPMILRLSRLLLLNGHLLPTAFLRREPLAFVEGLNPPASILFGARGYAVRMSGKKDQFHRYDRDVRLFFRLTLRGLYLTLRTVVAFIPLKRRYEKAIPSLSVSNPAWRDLLTKFR